MQVVSLVIGILAVVGMFLFTLPCLGAFNWVNVPIALIGLTLGIISVATAKSGSRGAGIAGIVLSAIAIVWGVIRLGLGGGLL